MTTILDGLSVTKLGGGVTERNYYDETQDGLRLRVRDNDGRLAKLFIVTYRLAGKEQKLALGSPSECKLDDARHRAYEIRRAAKDGEDPRVKFRPRPAYTMFDGVTDYLAYYKPRAGKSTYRQAKLYLRGSYFESLHKADVGKVAQLDVTNRLRAIEADHGRNTAHAARSLLNRFYGWLNRQGRFPDGVYNPVLGTEPPADRKFKRARRRKRTLTDAELVAVWNAAGDDNATYGRILRLAILTGCRRAEVGGMRKGELNLTARTWTIPAERYKTHVDHVVHLAPAAVAIIEAALAEAPGEGVFETAKVGKAGRPRKVAGFQDWSWYKAKLDERLGDGVAKWVVHDLRRTMRSGLGGLGVPPHIAEMCLGHMQPVIIATYDINDYAAELRKAWEAWADRVEQLTRPQAPELRLVA